jgi:hypothetical protein
MERSSNGFAPLVEKAMKAGAQQFIEKTGDFHDVLRTIRTYLGEENLGGRQNSGER